MEERHAEPTEETPCSPERDSRAEEEERGSDTDEHTPERRAEQQSLFPEEGE